MKKIKQIINWMRGSTQNNLPLVNSIPIDNTSDGPSITHSLLQRLAQIYDGKRLLRNEIQLDDVLFNNLVVQRYFTPIDAIKMNGFTPVCQRCYNSTPHLFAELPCSSCKKTHIYCRNCINMGRIKACDYLYYWTGDKYLWPKIEHPCTWKGKLTPSQLIAACQIKTTIEQGGEQLVWAVTGSGKTEMLFPGITTALQQGKRVCLASPRADVVRELLPRLRTAFQAIRVQGLYGGSRDKDGTTQLIIATTHQLFRYQSAFDVIIIDELDAFPYHNDEELQQATNRAAKNGCAKIYLTATPRKKQKKLIARGDLNHVFVPIRFHEQPLILPRMIICMNLQNSLKQGKLPRAFHRWLQKRHKKTRQILIFVPTIQLANELNQVITDLFMSEKLIVRETEIVTVHAADKNRKEKVAQFRNRHIYGLITTTILERGVTFPKIDVAVLDAGHLVFDEPALVQIAGRAGRSLLDPEGEVIFFHDGKTNAMVEAEESIVKMNERARKLVKSRDMR